MAQRKHHLQRHRIAAFSKTLTELENRLQNQIDFVTSYGSIYKMPPAIMKHNVKRYNRWLRSIQDLKDLEFKHI